MNKLKRIISEYVNIPEDSIDDNMSIQGDIGLDSFGLISMVTSIEEEFNVEIPDSALKNCQTLNDLYSFIDSSAN